MEIPENRLLAKIARRGGKGGAIIRGIGDDGAVIRADEGSYVYVQDALVEGIHFDLSLQSPFDVGRKAVTVNVSDCLAMGAEPLYYMVTLGIPDRIVSNQIDRLYRGMDKVGRNFNISLIGGDTTATREDFFVDVSMVGKLVVPEFLGRNTAKTGDLIGITGPLGEAAYGLELLKQDPTAPSRKYTRRYRSPELPYSSWKALIDARIPRAMMDVSDGLLIDLERMMEESRKGAILQLERIPMPPALKRQGRESWALSGGEDYQFLFTFDKLHIGKVKALMAAHLPMAVIGEVTAGRGIHLLDRGEEKRMAVKGYEHFGSRPA